jgi:hypothetical protein
MMKEYEPCPSLLRLTSTFFLPDVVWRTMNDAHSPVGFQTEVPQLP